MTTKIIVLNTVYYWETGFANKRREIDYRGKGPTSTQPINLVLKAN